MSKKQYVFVMFVVCFWVLFLVILDLSITFFAPYDRPAKPRNATTFVVSSPTRIQQFIPNAHFTYDGADYHTNSFGYRDREFPMKKPKNTMRIAMVGDSFVEGMGEKQENTLPAVLEKELNASGGKKVEVMNCGVRGGSPGHYVFWMRSLFPYKPDAFVVCIYDNDLKDDNSLLLKKAYYRAEAWWHLSPLCRKSSIVCYLQGEWANFKFKMRRRKIAQTLSTENSAQSWDRTQNYLNQIVQQMQRSQVRVLFVYIPTRPKDQVVFQADHLRDRLVSWALQRHVPLVDLSGPINQWVRHPGNPLLYQEKLAHFNELGLRKAAEWILPQLREIMIIWSSG